MHTVENGTSEVTEKLLEKIGLLAGDFVEAIALPAGLDVVASQTGAQLGVEDCIASQHSCSSGDAQLARIACAIADSLVELAFCRVIGGAAAAASKLGLG